MESLPDWLCEAKKLEVLDVSHNLITELPPWWVTGLRLKQHKSSPVLLLTTDLSRAQARKSHNLPVDPRRLHSFLCSLNWRLDWLSIRTRHSSSLSVCPSLLPTHSLGFKPKVSFRVASGFIFCRPSMRKNRFEPSMCPYVLQVALQQQSEEAERSLQPPTEAAGKGGAPSARGPRRAAQPTAGAALQPVPQIWQVAFIESPKWSFFFSRMV